MTGVRNDPPGLDLDQSGSWMTEMPGGGEVEEPGENLQTSHDRQEHEPHISIIHLQRDLQSCLALEWADLALWQEECHVIQVGLFAGIHIEPRAGDTVPVSRHRL